MKKGHNCFWILSYCVTPEYNLATFLHSSMFWITILCARIPISVHTQRAWLWTWAVKLERHIECWQKCWEQGSTEEILETTRPICHEVQLLLSGRGRGGDTGRCVNQVLLVPELQPETWAKSNGKIRTCRKNPLDPQGCTLESFFSLWMPSTCTTIITHKSQENREIKS